MIFEGFFVRYVFEEEKMRARPHDQGFKTPQEKLDKGGVPLEEFKETKK